MALAQEKQPAMNTLPRDILAGWKILVIDDEHDSADVATRVLRYYGADVSIACNGLEGLDLVQRTHPRLVICDISMPVLDGWGVIRTLKNERSLNGYPGYRADGPRHDRRPPTRDCGRLPQLSEQTAHAVHVHA
jgi:CheY-like chemotaxis protein